MRCSTVDALRKSRREVERVLVWAVVALLVVKASANVADLLVIGVDLDPADPRAYPIEIMNYHEIVNDRIGEKHVAVTWSPLTYSNVVIETEAFLNPKTIGTSGKVYQNNLVAYDRATHTMWSQIGGFALQGPLLGSSFVRVQSVLTKWSTWKRMYPNTKVLNRPASSTKNYLSDPYASYRKTDRLLYESCFEDLRMESPYIMKSAKEETLVVITQRGNPHLFPSSETLIVHNVDDLDDAYFVVLWDQASKLAYAYNRVVNGTTKLNFLYAGSTSLLGSGVSLPLLKDTSTGSIWNASGTAISGPLRGVSLPRLTSFHTYWAAATSFFPKSQIWIENATLQYFPSSCPRPSADSSCSVPCSSIVAAGPSQDAIKPIDSPTFMTPEEFEAIVRLPRKTITLYAILVSFFLILAASLFSYNLYLHYASQVSRSNAFTHMHPAPTSNGAVQAGKSDISAATLSSSSSLPPISSRSHSSATSSSGIKSNHNVNTSNVTEGLGSSQTASFHTAKHSNALHRSTLDSRLGPSLVLKDDDEEEPALPPENEMDLPKFATAATPSAPRRRKRKQKHSRSVSLVNDDNSSQSSGSIQSSVEMQVPMSARAPSKKFSSFGPYAVPRLSIASPWTPSSSNAASTTESLKGMERGGIGGGIGGSIALHSSSPSKGSLSVPSSSLRPNLSDSSLVQLAEIAEYGEPATQSDHGSPPSSLAGILSHPSHSSSIHSTSPHIISSRGDRMGSMDESERGGSSSSSASGASRSATGSEAGVGVGGSHGIQHARTEGGGHGIHSSSSSSISFSDRPSHFLDAPLIHRPPSNASSPASSTFTSPRSKVAFTEALHHTNSYSTSIDSISPDNYQISLTSVNSGDEDMPEHIMSAAALARIKGVLQRSSSSLAPASSLFGSSLPETGEPSSDDDDIPISRSKIDDEVLKLRQSDQTDFSQPSADDGPSLDLDY